MSSEPTEDEEQPSTESTLAKQYGWTARGDQLPAEKRVPFNRPKFIQICNALPFILRYSWYWLKHIRKKERLFINTFQPLRHYPFYGVPCGGIGSGSIGRDFRGGFCKFSLRPGRVEHHVKTANQFILTLRSGSTLVRQVVLSAVPFNKGSGCQRSKKLCAWDFSLPQKDVHYRGLYPRSWSRYELPEEQVEVHCRQISPIIPNNYKDSSLPASVFVFRVINNSERDLEASIAFTFCNGSGDKKANKGVQCTSETFWKGNVLGVRLDHSVDGMPCTYGLAASTSKHAHGSTCVSFKPSGTGENLWRSLATTGEFYDGAEDTDGSELGVGVCLKTAVPARTASKDLEFALVWHMPEVHFGLRGRRLKRWYSRFFDQSADAAEDICEYALNNYRQWEAAIDAWQKPVLENPSLPDWFKSALFNELYFLTDGGSMWFDFDEEWPRQEPQMTEYTAKVLREHGRFGYLESWEYRMVNTYDVHFYASFALAELFPNLEHSVQADIRDHIDHFDDNKVKFHMEGDTGPQKSYLRVPHDLGNPADDPWLMTNAYVMHDTGKWKDLNLKFVLTSYRDYFVVLKSDKAFLDFIWPAVKNLMEEALLHWDRDGDGMIENFGVADQTYDAWKMVGVSAYCGSLWLAALRVAAEMGREAGDKEAHVKYTEILRKAKKVYEEKLWNGRYYNFDEGSLSQDTVMADQLCGYWYLAHIRPDMAADIIPADHVKSVLDAVYELNVMKFANGEMGAVNGMRPNGEIDFSYIQADEVWTGVTYALASFFMQQDQLERGLHVAEGCYETCYNRTGLQFQTPEAIYKKRFYRAIGYMRPLSIWAIMFSIRATITRCLRTPMRTLFTQEGPAKVQTEGEKRIEKLLKDRFRDATLVGVEDISSGCGAMYKIQVETPEFAGKIKVQQHKLITETLKGEIKDMHGIVIETKAA
ncbi:bile acid beta-glucosidase [Aphelenchoides avenae]|nr:bile acid beta-glucosidase [Aphelenchus avenae]